MVKGDKYTMRTASLEKRRQNVARKESALTVERAVCGIHSYFNETGKDTHGRYLSWCHCYDAFKNNRNHSNGNTIDYLALHLAFYLASWGMYRGSSFLLQKDYKVHIPVVEILMENKYNSLLGASAESLQDEAILDLLDEVSDRIRQTYAKEQPSFEGVSNHATDTLVTKILLGTLGCVPAYDRYYVQAVRRYGISTGGYDRKSVKDVAKFYLNHKDEFEKVRVELSAYGTEYPVMKLMDMCLWQVAYEDSVGQE